jgi:pyruvate,orthophosphate dikinase
MMELPRACITADEIAEHAQFFSFGTNDLTQTTLGFSRDDVGKFIPAYIEKKIMEFDPFQRLDEAGVGELIKMSVEKGRRTRKDLKIGICGEHGGEPHSIDFCHRNGLNYVSCSPYRVPTARLAAAQSALRHGKK